MTITKIMTLSFYEGCTEALKYR